MPQFARVLGGFDGGSGPFKKLRAWSLKPPRGAETPPGPGFAWGLFRGGGPAVTWGGSSADPGARPNSRRGEIFRPPGRTDGRDARTRPRRLMGAPRARGRPSRALPHGPSPRPVVPPPPLRQPWPWGREAPSFAPADGRSSGPFFGASLRGLPPSPPPLDGAGGPGSGRQEASVPLAGGPGSSPTIETADVLLIPILLSLKIAFPYL